MLNELGRVTLDVVGSTAFGCVRAWAAGAQLLGGGSPP